MDFNLLIKNITVIVIQCKIKMRYYKNKYNEILAKRFPNSKSDESSSLQTPARNLSKGVNKKKFSFHIPAHLKSKSKEFLGAQNRDGLKYNLEILSKGKYSMNENQSYSNITKRRLLQNLKGKLSPPIGRVINPRHAQKANKARYMKEIGANNRSESLPSISKDRPNPKQIPKNPSDHSLSGSNKSTEKKMNSNRDLDFKMFDEHPYGKSNQSSFFSKNQLNSKQIIERKGKKQNKSFGQL